MAHHFESIQLEFHSTEKAALTCATGEENIHIQSVILTNDLRIKTKHDELNK